MLFLVVSVAEDIVMVLVVDCQGVVQTSDEVSDVLCQLICSHSVVGPHAMCQEMERERQLLLIDALASEGVLWPFEVRRWRALVFGGHVFLHIPA